MAMSLPAHLQADCKACRGLCCVALPFDAFQGFGFDKPAGAPCRHLAPDFQCTIHERLADAGFHGCTVFDCHGAGQRVTEEFGDTCWTESEATAHQMFNRFFVLRQLHELRMLLTVALEHTRPHTARARLAARRDEITALCNAGNGIPIDLAAVRRDTVALLRDVSGRISIAAASS